MTQITDSHICCALTKFYYELQIRNGELIWVNERGLIQTRPLPAGSWQFLFTTDGATEEQAASVVQLISNGKISGRPQYRRYDRDWTKDMPAACWTRDARHSLETLLRSKGLPEGNYAILLKINK